jgi:hypothetical protein
MLVSFVFCMYLLSAVTSFSLSNETSLFNLALPLLNIVEEPVDSSSSIVAAAPTSRSFASGIANINILTLFKYNGSQIYVYGSASNEGEPPQKWIFYYVPVMAPIQSSSTDQWVLVSEQ